MDPLTIFTIVAASYATIDLIVKHARALSESLEDRRSLKASVENLQAFTIQGAEQMLYQRLDLAKSILQGSTKEDVKRNLDANFQKIQMDINNANALFKEIKDPPGRNFIERREKKKAKEEELKVVLVSLKTAESLFTSGFETEFMKKSLPSNALLSKDNFQIVQVIDFALPDNISLVQGHLVREEPEKYSRRGRFILEARLGPEADVRKLAEKVMPDEAISLTPRPGILKFVGYQAVSDTPNTPYYMVFSILEGNKQEGTLQDFIQTTSKSPPALNVRIDLCHQLASAVLQVHQMDLVHKNVNTANVLVTNTMPAASKTAETQNSSLNVFLIDWHLTRIAHGATSGKIDRRWWRRLYQHPDRHMQPCMTEYTMYHDIYSLSVCMIEVLLWKSLLQGHERGPQPGVASGSLLDQPPTESPEPSAILKEVSGLQAAAEIGELPPPEMQDVLEKLARTLLPAAVGDRLTALVVACLNCQEGSFGQLSFAGKSSLETCSNFVSTVMADLWQVKLAVR